MIQKIAIYISIVVLICILLIMFVLLFYGCAPSKDTISEIRDLDISKFKSGDIIGNELSVQFIVKSGMESIFGHVGIIYVDPDNNQVYVMEGIAWKDGILGLGMLPLERWLYYVNGKYKICHVPINKSADSRKLFKVFKRVTRFVELDWPNITWLRFLFKRPYIHRKIHGDGDLKKYKMTCIEFATFLLQEVGVFKKVYDCSSVLTRRLLYGGIETLDGYKYDHPYILSAIPLKHYDCDID